MIDTAHLREQLANSVLTDDLRDCGLDSTAGVLEALPAILDTLDAQAAEIARLRKLLADVIDDSHSYESLCAVHEAARQALRGEVK
jgi:hypothetical protein